MSVQREKGNRSSSPAVKQDEAYKAFVVCAQKFFLSDAVTAVPPAVVSKAYYLTSPVTFQNASSQQGTILSSLRATAQMSE